MTILVQITWQRNPNYYPHDETSNVIMKYHLYIFDDKSDNSYFVQHFLLFHWQSVLDSAFNLSPIGFGQMGVFPNLKEKAHGSL